MRVNRNQGGEVMHVFHKWNQLTPDEAQVKIHGEVTARPPFNLAAHWPDWCPYPWRHCICDVCGLIKAQCSANGAYQTLPVDIHSVVRGKI